MSSSISVRKGEKKADTVLGQNPRGGRRPFAWRGKERGKGRLASMPVKNG